MKFTNSIYVLAAASAASAAYINGTETATEIATTVVTITSCHDNACSEVPVTTGLTTVTLDSTIYTTYCPLTSDEAEASPAPTEAPAEGTETATEISTTVVTITSCHDNACSEVPVTTGLTTVTLDSTIYTTYCPLTTETPAESPAEESSPATVAAESTPAEESPAEESSPVTVAAESTPAEESTPATVAAESTSVAESTVASVDVATNGAGKLAPGLVAAAVVFLSALY